MTRLSRFVLELDWPAPRGQSIANIHPGGLFKEEHEVEAQEVASLSQT